MCVCGWVKAMGKWMEGWGNHALGPANDECAGCFDERAAGRAFDSRVGSAPDGVVGAAGRGRVLPEELESVEEILRDSCEAAGG